MEYHCGIPSCQGSVVVFLQIAILIDKVDRWRSILGEGMVWVYLDMNPSLAIFSVLLYKDFQSHPYDIPIVSFVPCCLPFFE